MFRTLCLVPTWIILLSGSLSAAEPIRVACIGDSITEGPGLAKAWPAQLQTHLGKSYDVRNFGVGAATLLVNGDKPYVRQPEYREAIEFAPKIVVIMLGTNDSKPANAAQLRNIQKDLATLKTPFLAKRAKIYVCTPPVVKKDNWGIEASVLGEKVVPKIRSALKRTNAEIIDIHEVFKQKEGNFWMDGIHLNQTGSDIVAEEVAEAIK